MAGRLAGKRAIIVGAGQEPGETVGNGRAMAMTFAREGADVMCVDRDLARAEETVALIGGEGGNAFAHAANIVKDAECHTVVEAALARWGGIDILVNNVGVGWGGDGPAHLLSDDAFDRTMTVNLKAMWQMIRATLPSMREARSGVVVNISSLASVAGGFQLAYELSKAGVNRLTTSVAQFNGGRGIRCNAILPGLMDTPMAVAGIAGATDRSVEDVRAERNKRVPLAGGMGSGWDTANAALFLASDEAKFITGVLLPVDGGASVRIG